MSKIIIKKIKAGLIKNSAGRDSIEITLTTEKGDFTSSVPEGTSKGKAEAEKYLKPIKSIILSLQKLKLPEIGSLADILAFEEKTAKLGGNPTLAVTYALLKALAAEQNIPVWKLFNPQKKSMPHLLNKMLGGGKHSSEKSPTIQEFLTLTRSSFSYAKSIKNNIKIYNKIKSKYSPQTKDLEGGWILDISDNKAFEILKSVSGFRRIGADFASSSFYNTRKKLYIYKDKQLTGEEQFKYMLSLQKKYGIWYIEDPFHENDFESFAKLTKAIGSKALITGDDLLSTTPERLKKAINLGACNGAIVKPDQIGSISKTIEFVKMAKENGIIPVISHRSGETNENMLADLAVGLEIPIMKISLSGEERLAKINRLLEISKE